MCLKSDELHDHPVPEPHLKSCSEWKDSSCCPPTTADLITKESLHGFNFNFCNITEKCREFFLDEYCMVKCSPHLGPWIVKVPSSKFEENVFKVPLCESDCNSWYEACKNSTACATNWRSGGFDWSSGTNQCHKGYKCLEISNIYGSAKAFCESVWDNSYSVIQSDSVGEWNVTDYHCMHIPRNASDRAAENIKHNAEVAKRQAEVIIERVYGD
nr:folate receptor beta [Hymenolepis microstoma]